MRNAIARRVFASQQRTQDKSIIHGQRLCCRHLVYRIFSLVNQERTLCQSLESADLVFSRARVASSIPQVPYANARDRSQRI